MSLIGTNLRYAPPGRAAILDRVSFALSKGEIIGIGGKSGAGKSTLARILSGHTMPTEGRVEVDGQGVLRKGQARPVQYVPQSSELASDPRWSVARILANGAAPPSDVLEALGVHPTWAHRYPAELSGGELQRVSLARLLGPETRYLICDEISAQLDALSQKELWNSLVGICQRRGIGIVIISHEAELRHRWAKKSFILEGGTLVSTS